MSTQHIPEPEDELSFGPWLRSRRETLRLSQSAVGEACGGVSYQAVQQWERGVGKPTTSRVFQLATVLEVPPAEVLERVTRAYRWAPADCLLQAA